MALGTLIEKLRAKKQTAHRSVFSEYLDLVTALAKDAEVDHDEAEHILKAASKSFDDDLPRNVTTKKERFARRSVMDMNRQAVLDRQSAEAELQRAQRAMQAAVDKLQPPIDAARAQLADANHRALISTGAESWLCDPENILDVELLAKERELSAELKPVNAELKPLLFDRQQKQHSLGNAELRLRTLSGRDSSDWKAWGIVDYFHQNADVQAAEQRVADLKSELQQLENAIQPRLQEQQRLQRELDAIHNEKLKP